MTQNTLSKSVLYYLEENWGQKVTEYCATGDLVENPGNLSWGIDNCLVTSDFDQLEISKIYNINLFTIMKSQIIF